MRMPFIAGNWKMFKTREQALAFAEEFKRIYTPTDIKVAVFAPYTQLGDLVEAFKGSPIYVGAQNMHFENEGAYTGEISPLMLKELGVSHCILGHSERRQYFNEDDESCNKKLQAAFNHDILPVFCVGENLDQRQANKAFSVVESQLNGGLKAIKKEDIARLTIAYEPVWAIGTGKTATPEEANEMCGFIREKLINLYGDEIADKVVIQYGGSVKPSNATEIMNMEEIDGALVGGASLDPKSFMEIIDF
ncbi:MAG: triose-phosphate isomerase [Anaerovoracaceae bacterium]|jgi:triosephosphate isomerase|nr:triose-phosphate isomerase [Anaerovoracaceae bacterium]